MASLAQREVFGRDVPFGPPELPEYEERHRLLHEGLAAADWARGQTPEDGDLVLMAAVPDGPDIHCGTYFAGLGVYHTNHRHGVVMDAIVELEAVQHWHLSFWRPKAS